MCWVGHVEGGIRAADFRHDAPSQSQRAGRARHRFALLLVPGVSDRCGPADEFLMLNARQGFSSTTGRSWRARDGMIFCSECEG
jgi:hypothetical protein